MRIRILGIACPWCWIGKKHLDQALERFEHDTTIVWRAFELDPEAPAERSNDIDYIDRLASKYRTSRGGAQQMIDQMTERGAASGLDHRRLPPRDSPAS